MRNLDSFENKTLNENDWNLDKEISYSNYETNLETIEKRCGEALNVFDDETDGKNSEEVMGNEYTKKFSNEEKSENSLTLKDESNTVSFETGDGDNVLPKNSNNLLSVNTWIEDSILQATSINTQKCGLPLQIFSEV